MQKKRSPFGIVLTCLSATQISSALGPPTRLWPTPLSWRWGGTGGASSRSRDAPGLVPDAAMRSIAACSYSLKESWVACFEDPPKKEWLVKPFFLTRANFLLCTYEVQFNLLLIMLTSQFQLTEEQFYWNIVSSTFQCRIYSFRQFKWAMKWVSFKVNNKRGNYNFLTASIKWTVFSTL